VSTLEPTMRITIDERGLLIRERLRDRLERAAQLRCEEHGKPVAAVVINGWENGWFDSRWTTCCEALEQQAAAIVKQRC